MREMTAIHRHDRPAPLSPSQLAAYARSGWVLARAFCGAAEVGALARWADELLALPEKTGEHMVYYEPSLIDASRRCVQRVENFCPYHAPFDAFVRAGAIRRAVDQLVGGPTCLFKEKINFKMPGGSGFAPHQDQQAGWSRYAPLFVTALVTIDPATVENGCLEMADAPRVTGLIGEEWRPLTTAEMDGFALAPVPTQPGDVLFFDSYAPHASKPNLTDRARRMLYLTYNRAADGDHRAGYFVDKRANFPPDAERRAGVAYTFRV
jgi:2-aminoethylphosphonate dioxygenase